MAGSGIIRGRLLGFLCRDRGGGGEGVDHSAVIFLPLINKEKILFFRSKAVHGIRGSVWR